MLISEKRLAQMAKKWERISAIGRKTVKSISAEKAKECCTSVPPEGHCVLYSAGERRFNVPLAYVGTTIFAELLRISQEKFGFISNRRITLPCDAVEMEYVMCLLRRNASKEVQRAFLSSVVWTCHHGNGFAPPMGLRQ